MTACGDGGVRFYRWRSRMTGERLERREQAPALRCSVFFSLVILEGVKRLIESDFDKTKPYKNKKRVETQGRVDNRKTLWYTMREEKSALGSFLMKAAYIGTRSIVRWGIDWLIYYFS